MKNKPGLVVLVIAVLIAPSAIGQRTSVSQRDGTTVLAHGNPPLTVHMVNQLLALYEFLLEIRLSAEQRTRFQQGVVRNWTENDREGIEAILRNLKYTEQSTDDLRAFRESSQSAIVESMRRNTDAVEERVLIEAFDNTHPDRRVSTRARGFNDLVGTWKKQDALGASVDPNNGAARGVSFTDSGTLEITSNGAYKLVKVHNHCEGGCCRLDGSEEYGTVSLEAKELQFNIARGSKLVKDDCNSRLNERVLIKPHLEHFPWSVRLNPNNNATTLCLNTGEDTAECYEKQ